MPSDSMKKSLVLFPVIVWPFPLILTVLFAVIVLTLPVTEMSPVRMIAFVYRLQEPCAVEAADKAVRTASLRLAQSPGTRRGFCAATGATDSSMNSSAASINLKANAECKSSNAILLPDITGGG